MKGFTALILSLAGFVIVTLWYLTAVKDTSSTVWHMPTSYSASNYQTQAHMAFAKDVQACTSGRIEIRVHPSGSLLKGSEIKRAVSSGAVPIGERLLSSHLNENAFFATDSVPFLAANFKDATALWEASKEPLDDILEEDGLALLYSVLWPPQGMYFRKQVNVPEDLKGIKLRTYTAANIELASLAGMIPIQIEASELSQALAVGVVDSVLASGATGYDRKLWEHLSYFYDLQAWLPRNYVFVNLSKFNALSKADQNCFREAARKTELDANNKAIELTDWYLSQLESNGIDVLLPSPELKVLFDKIGEAQKARWLKDTAPYGQQVLSNYDAYLARKIEPK